MARQRDRYQQGSLEIRDTAEGRCWYIRFMVDQPDGSRKRKPFRVGLLKDLPTKRHANNAADELRRTVNSPAPIIVERKVRDAVERYMREEMPERYSTAKGYRNLLVNHIRPQWGDRNLTTLTGEEIRSWLKTMKCSPKTRGHRRDMMRVLFNFAIFWKWHPGPNPAESFRLEDVTKRMKKPIILTPQQFTALIKHPMLAEEPYRTMCVMAASLGLRCSELCGLQWRDVLWDRGEIHVQRAIVEGHHGEVKTEHSDATLPLHEEVKLLLRSHLHSKDDFKEPDDWIFASPFTGGAKPYFPGGIQQNRIRVAGRDLGFGKSIGWHTFRHSYRAWLGNTRAEMGVQQALMRHSNIATTMNVYGAAFVEDLREANDGVVRRLIQ